MPNQVENDIFHRASGSGGKTGGKCFPPEPGETAMNGDFVLNQVPKQVESEGSNSFHHQPPATAYGWKESLPPFREASFPPERPSAPVGTGEDSPARALKDVPSPKDRPNPPGSHKRVFQLTKLPDPVLLPVPDNEDIPKCFTCGAPPVSVYRDGSPKWDHSHMRTLDDRDRDVRGPLPQTAVCPSCGGERASNRSVFLCQKTCPNFRGYSKAN